MAQPVLLPAAFDGMAQDFPRNAMPKGKAWNLVDYIPEILGAPATERGGWSYASNSLTSADASATYVTAALYAPFTAGSELLCVDDQGHLLKIAALVPTDKGAVGVPLQNPILHQQNVIVPSPDGAVQMFKYTGGAITGLGTSTVPTARYLTVFVNRTVAASTTANPNRVYFSAAGDGTTYSMTGTSASYIDVGFPVTGLAALPNVLLVFGKERTARITGTTPPPGTDMTLLDPAFQYGCTDARSVAVNGPYCVFANPTGVFLTNGTGYPEDLTLSCGIKKYWRDTLSTYSASTWTLAGGWFGNYYVIAVMNGSTFVDSFVFDVGGQHRSAYRVSNLKAVCFAAAGQVGTELYAGLRSAPRLAALSTMWTPGSSVKNDADGTAVLGVWESPYYDTQHLNTQRWRWVYLDYDLRDAASDGPTATVSITKSPEPGAAYTALSRTLTKTSARKIDRLPMNTKNTGLAFKVTRTNSSSVARLYAIGTVAHEQEKFS